MRFPIRAVRVCCLAALVLNVPVMAEVQEAAPVPPASASAPATSSGPIPIRRIEDTGQSGGGPDEPKYSVDASWVIAGYNDNEVIYSIIITNQDQRIIRCSTLLSGFYLENGTKHSISDRQGVTIFPGKQSSAGHWLGMDQASGASYKITCRAVS